jgi:DNA polymerase-3 subunit gamma/tau
VTEPLRQALRSGRVHHAYLFSGPRGCGKTSSARILARSLNCEQGPTPDPCGVCASCVALAPSGPGSIDVIEIDAASHGGVDDARDLRERAFYAPVSGRFKIYIVDEAHMVTREGFNALLKLVEEPPPHLKFVFATTEPEKVIATIRSRTHHYPFRLMPPAVLRGLLEEILDAEGVSYEPAVLPVVIRAGAGSARDALSVLDQLLAGADESGISYERAVALLGYTDDSLLDDVTDAFAAGEGAAVFHAIDRVVEGGHDPRRFAADLLDRFRDLIVLAAVPDAGETGLLDVPADRLDRMREQAARFGRAELTSAAETISAGLVEMRGATSPRLLLELMCAQVLLPPADASQQALLARLDRLERRIGTGDAATDAAPRITSSPRPAAPEPPAQRPGPPPADASMASGTRSPSASPPGPPSPPQPARRAAERSAPQAPGAGADSGPAGGPGGSGGPGGPGGSPGSPGGPGGGPGGPGGDDISRRWDSILDEVKGERRVSWILLRDASVHSLSDGVLTLNFTREGEAKGFMAGGHDQVLSLVLKRTLGISPQIRTVIGAPGGQPPAARPAARAGSGGQSGDASWRGSGGTGPGGSGLGAGPAAAGQGGHDDSDADVGQGAQPGAGQGAGRPGRTAAGQAGRDDDADWERTGSAPGGDADQRGNQAAGSASAGRASAGPASASQAGDGGRAGSGNRGGRSAQARAGTTAGRAGSDGAGSDGAGSAGVGSAGVGSAGPVPERAAAGRAGSGDAESGRAGPGRAGPGRAGSGRAGSGRAGSGRAESGRAGSGRAGSGRGGAGRPGAPGRAGGTGAGQPADAHPGEDSDADADALTGADLIERELGGQVIEDSGEA